MTFFCQRQTGNGEQAKTAKTNGNKRQRACLHVTNFVNQPSQEELSSHSRPQMESENHKI